MMAHRIAVITDVHANLPALDAALAVIGSLGCDAIVHTGDAVGIGPFPAETLDRLLDVPGMRFAAGNHDAWLAHDVASHPPAWMDADEVAHHRWVSEQVGQARREAVATWPPAIDDEIGEIRARFTHYAKPDGRGGFASIARDPSPADLDALFGDAGADIVFYGHHHPRSDLTGHARYVNPGALGCHDVAVARFAVLDVSDGGFEVTFHEAPYDAAPVLRALDDRQVPEREMIRRAFLRFPG
jgi:predicted phosphodiesterase